MFPATDEQHSARIRRRVSNGFDVSASSTRRAGVDIGANQDRRSLQSPFQLTIRHSHGATRAAYQVVACVKGRVEQCRRGSDAGRKGGDPVWHARSDAAIRSRRDVRREPREPRRTTASCYGSPPCQ